MSHSFMKPPRPLLLQYIPSLQGTPNAYMMEIKVEKCWGGGRGIKRKTNHQALFLALLKWKICAPIMKIQLWRQPHPQGEASILAVEACLSFTVFDLLQSRQETLTWYIACVFYRFPRFRFLNFPSISSICACWPPEMTKGMNHPVLQNVASFMSLED